MLKLIELRSRRNLSTYVRLTIDKPLISALTVYDRASINCRYIFISLASNTTSHAASVYYIYMYLLRRTELGPNTV